MPPTILSEHWKSPNHTAFQGITLDYYRFTTDTMIRTFTEEKDAIRAHSDLPVTTNFMGLYKPLTTTGGHPTLTSRPGITTRPTNTAPTGWPLPTTPCVASKTGNPSGSWSKPLHHGQPRRQPGEKTWDPGPVVLAIRCPRR